MVNLAALFWIFSRVSMLFCLCGFHATGAYSSLGLINMLYAVSLTLCVAGWRVRFRKPSVA